MAALCSSFSPKVLAIKEVVPAKIPTPNAMIIKEIGKALDKATRALADIFPA